MKEITRGTKRSWLRVVKYEMDRQIENRSLDGVVHQVVESLAKLQSHLDETLLTSPSIYLSLF